MSLPKDSAGDTGLASAIKSRTAHVVHLTHNDLDAVGADAIHRMKFGTDGVFSIWSSVGKFSALFSLVASCEGKGDLLSISDLGYHRETEETAAKAKKNGWVVEWRDHHRWRDEEVTTDRGHRLPPPYRYVCLRNRDCCPRPCTGEPCSRRDCPGCLRLRSLETCRSRARQCSGRCSSARRTGTMSATASLRVSSATTRSTGNTGRSRPRWKR